MYTSQYKFTAKKLLKKDVFGYIEQGLFEQNGAAIPAIRRVYGNTKWLYRLIARWLASHERKALLQLEVLQSNAIPKILAYDQHSHIRSFISGASLHHSPPPLSYYKTAKQLLTRIRKAGVSHNDLAKEANWLVMPDDEPALVDFQMAWIFKNPTKKLLRILSREDLRHLLKHKRTYYPKYLTYQERNLLNKPGFFSKLWRLTGKKIYWVFTRKILRWPERVGPEERG